MGTTKLNEWINEASLNLFENSFIFSKINCKFEHDWKYVLGLSEEVCKWKCRMVVIFHIKVRLLHSSEMLMIMMMIMMDLKMFASANLQPAWNFYICMMFGDFLHCIPLVENYFWKIGGSYDTSHSISIDRNNRALLIWREIFHMLPCLWDINILIWAFFEKFLFFRSISRELWDTW